jgi:hypothetical protein
MPPILNALAVVACSHGGTFKVAVPSAEDVLAGGAPVLTVADVWLPLTPCPFLTPAGVPKPCLEVTPIPPTAAVVVKANEIPVLLETTQFVTIGIPPECEVMEPGQVLVQGI